MHVVDSCGWLSYFTDDGNASFFAPLIEDTANLLLPGIVVYEVSRRLVQLYGEAGQAQGLRYLRLAQYVAADWDIHFAASQAAARHKLHMADAIIWQTAQSHSALLYTQDAAFANVPGVVYQAKL